MTKIIYTELKSKVSQETSDWINLHGVDVFLTLPDDDDIVFKVGYLYKLNGYFMRCSKIIQGCPLFHKYTII